MAAQPRHPSRAHRAPRGTTVSCSSASSKLSLRPRAIGVARCHDLLDLASSLDSSECCRPASAQKSCSAALSSPRLDTIHAEPHIDVTWGPRLSIAPGLVRDILTPRLQQQRHRHTLLAMSHHDVLFIKLRSRWTLSPCHTCGRASAPTPHTRCSPSSHPSSPTTLTLHLPPPLHQQ
jgi:hypothetical protein